MASGFVFADSNGDLSCNAADANFSGLNAIVTAVQVN